MTNEIDTYYSKDGRKHAVVNATASFIYVEFYHDEILVGGLEVANNSIYYAQSIAENYCNDIIQLKPWRSNEILERNLHKPGTE
jgi:hypothetical protein